MTLVGQFSKVGLENAAHSNLGSAVVNRLVQRRIMGSHVTPSFQQWHQPKYVDSLVECSPNTIVDCVKIKCYTLPKIAECSDAIMADWALHVRRHYIFDEKLRSVVRRRSVAVEEYLRASVIPDKRETMSGDFGEMLIADLLECIENYSVPRYKHCDRLDKNQSEHGTDVIGYRVSDPRSNDPKDELIVVEVKALTSSGYIKGVVNKAKKDSKKDRVDLSMMEKSRLGMTLDYLEWRSYDYGDSATAVIMQRFLKAAEFPCVIRYGIGAIAATDNSSALIEKNHQYDEFDTLDKVLVLGGSELADLLTRIYESCSK